MCIIGPSGPTGRPAPTAHEQEKNLTQMAGRLSTWRMTVPLRKPMTSGIPEPPASWHMNCTSTTFKQSISHSRLRDYLTQWTYMRVHADILLLLKIFNFFFLLILFSADFWITSSLRISDWLSRSAVILAGVGCACAWTEPWASAEKLRTKDKRRHHNTVLCNCIF